MVCRYKLRFLVAEYHVLIYIFVIDDFYQASNRVEDIIKRGFRFPSNGDGMVFTAGNIDMSKASGGVTYIRLYFCLIKCVCHLQLFVSHAHAAGRPSSLPALPGRRRPQFRGG
jgi:hypothetical protein